jgi:NAD(P)H-dependent flavin oxidoreductase YrpB (nitropropane dioxygenase family)
MRTVLCDRLGIAIPIVLAPMGGAVGPRLAAAVSNAGGLGTIPLWRADIETLNAQIREIRSLTNKPFAVNLNLDFPQEERLEACLKERVPVISFFWGDPSALVPRAKAGGAIVMQTVSTAREAQDAVQCGVDIIVAQEMGGRWSRARLCCDDGAGTSRRRCRGANADCCSRRHRRWSRTSNGPCAWSIWCVDRHAISRKCGGHHPSTLPRTTIECLRGRHGLPREFVRYRPNAPHRVLSNKTVSQWDSAGRPGTGKRPGEGEVVAISGAIDDIVRYRALTPAADVEGDIEALSMWADQGVALVKKVQPAAEIVREIHADASAIMKRLGAMSV